MRHPGAQLWIWLLSAIWLTCLFPSLLDAASSASTVQVSATIQPWLRFHVVQNVHAFQVTAEDLQRGFVDVIRSATIEVKTNEQRDLWVGVISHGPAEVLIKGASSGAFARSSGSLNIGRQFPGLANSKDIDCRILIPAGTREGVYPLSLTLALQSD